MLEVQVFYRLGVRVGLRGYFYFILRTRVLLPNASILVLNWYLFSLGLSIIFFFPHEKQSTVSSFSQSWMWLHLLLGWDEIGFSINVPIYWVHFIT